MNYYTLVTLQGGKWSPQFGDYEREVVKQEIEDSYDGEICEIIHTKDDQASIDAAITLKNKTVTAEFLEKTVAEVAVNELIDQGFMLSLCDGEEWVITKSSDAKAILIAMFSTGEDDLQIIDSSNRVIGYVYFISGNCPHELINDFTDALEPYLQKTLQYEESLESWAMEHTA